MNPLNFFAIFALALLLSNCGSEQTTKTNSFDPFKARFAKGVETLAGDDGHALSKLPVTELFSTNGEPWCLLDPIFRSYSNFLKNYSIYEAKDVTFAGRKTPTSLSFFKNKLYCISMNWSPNSKEEALKIVGRIQKTLGAEFNSVGSEKFQNGIEGRNWSYESATETVDIVYSINPELTPRILVSVSRMHKGVMSEIAASIGMPPFNWGAGRFQGAPPEKAVQCDVPEVLPNCSPNKYGCTPSIFHFSADTKQQCADGVLNLCREMCEKNKAMPERGTCTCGTPIF